MIKDLVFGWWCTGGGGCHCHAHLSWPRHTIHTPASHIEHQLRGQAGLGATSKPLWYCENTQNSNTWNICCNYHKIWTVRLCHRVMYPKDADGMTNTVMILSFRTDRSWQTACSLIRIYTVCNSSLLLWMHYSSIIATLFKFYDICSKMFWCLNI